MQYVGPTGLTLRTRFANHRYCIKHNITIRKKTSLGIHFYSIYHQYSHLRVTPIDCNLTLSNYDRKAKEAYWQFLLGTNKN